MATEKRSPRSDGRPLFLETVLAVVMIFTPLFFGAVYSWVSMSAAAVLFLAVFFSPGIVPCFGDLPQPFVYGVLSVLIYALIQSFFISKSPLLSFEEFIFWAALTAGFLLIQKLEKKSARRLLLLLIPIAFAESIYSFYQLKSGNETILWQAKKAHLGFATGTYFNRNHFAGLLELGLGIHLGAWLAAWQKKCWRVLSLLSLSLIVCAGAFVLSGSRAGQASFCLALIFFIPALLFKQKKTFLPALVLFGLLSIPVTIYREPLMNRFSALLGTLSTGEGRFLIWRDCLRLLRDHFWAGIGLGHFKWYFPIYQNASNLSAWSHAHNDYLELAITLGVPAVSVLCAAFVFFLLQLGRRVMIKADSEFYLLWGGLAGCFSLLLHSCVDFNLAIPANSLVLIFLLSGIWKMTDLRP